MPVSLLLPAVAGADAFVGCCALLCCAAAAGVGFAAAAVAILCGLLYALCVAGHERWARHIDRFVHRLGL